MNEIEKKLQKVIQKKNKIYYIDELIYAELIKVLMKEPGLLEPMSFSINNKLLSEALSYNIKLFELIDRLFNDINDFRLPFLKDLQKSMQNLIVKLQNPDNGSSEIQLRKVIISTIVKWNSCHGKILPQISLCLNFIRSKFKGEVKDAEERLQKKLERAHRHQQLCKDEAERNYQHLLDIYRENRIIIKASLKTIETCFSLLVPDVTEHLTDGSASAIISASEGSIFPGLDDDLGMAAEFLGPSMQKTLKMPDIAIDLSRDNLCVEIHENRDNEDIIRTLREEVSVLQRRIVPLLNNIIKKLKTFDHAEADLKPVYELSWSLLDALKNFDKMRIIRNDTSANLLSSDSEQDDDDFIDVL